MPFSRKLQHFAFSLRQGFIQIVRGTVSCLEVRIYGTFRKLRAEIAATCKRLMYRVYEIISTRVFQHVARCSLCECRKHIILASVHRKYDGFDSWELSFNIPNQIYALESGDAKVGDQHIWLKFPNHVHPLQAICGFTNHIKTSFGVQEHF